MADLKTKIGLVTVKISSPPPGAVLVVAGRPIADTDWGRPIPVDPGPVDISLSSTEGEEKRQITIAAGGSQTVRLGPEEETPDATTTAPSTTSTPDTDAAFNPFDGGADQRMVSYIAGGVGAAGLLTFAIFGGLHLSQYGDLEDSCTDGVCPADLEDDADTGRTYQTVANVSLVFGLVGVAAGTALFFTSDWMTLFDGEGSSAALSIGPGSVMVTGSF